MNLTYNPKDVFVVQRNATSSSFEEKVLTSAPNSYLLFDSASNLVTIPSSSISINTGSTYPITASWAANTISTTEITSSISASWASSSLSASYSETASWASASSYPWRPTGSNISYIGGNVGIGLVEPTDYLDVDFSAASQKGITIRNSSANSNAASTITFGNDNSTAGVQLINNSSNNTNYGGANSFNIINIQNSPITFFTSGNLASDERMRISETGKVSIGTTASVDMLNVAGNISCSVITASLFYGTSSWSNNAVTSSGVFPLSIKTTDYTLTTADYTIIMSGSTNLTASLPTSVGNFGKVYNIKNVTPTTILVSGSQNIDDSTYKLITQWNTMTIVSNDIQWLII